VLAKESDANIITAPMDIDDDFPSSQGSVLTTTATHSLPHVTPPAKRFHPAPDDSSSALSQRGRVSLSPGPPLHLAAQSSASSLGTRIKYDDRKGVGQVVATYKPQNELTTPSITRSSSSPKCSLDYLSFSTNVREPYRHMFTTLDERADALDQHLVERGEEMVDRYNLGAEEDGQGDVAPLEAVGVPRQETICCIGRICNAVSCLVSGVAS
jgi:hypothetical protein